MYKLKQLPEDFIVTEIPAAAKNRINSNGKYLYFWMKKRNKNTLDAVAELAKRLRIKEKEIGFAGSKDKHAVTKQMISVAGSAIAGQNKKDFVKANLENVSFDFYGYGNKPISLGDLEGNKFEIIIRNLEEEKVEKIDLLENYFDEQRFSGNNAAVGKHLLKKEFADVVLLIDEMKVARYLEQKPKDYVGALKLLPLRLLRLYVNAYQSYLWNKTVALYLEKNGRILKKILYSGGELVFVSDAERFKPLKIPLVGFGYDDLDGNLNRKGTLADIQIMIDKVLEEEGLSYSDFIIKQVPELTLEGELRTVFVEIKNLKIGKRMKDELNPGKRKVKVSFILPKGSYATMAVKKMVC